MSEPGTRLCGGDGGQGLANRPFERAPQVSMVLSNLPISPGLVQPDGLYNTNKEGHSLWNSEAI